MSKSSQITLPFITAAANFGLGLCINKASEQVLPDWNHPTLVVMGIAILFGVLPYVANSVSERSEADARTRWVWVTGLCITGFAFASLWMLMQWTALPKNVVEMLGYTAVGLFVFGVLFPPIALLLLALRQGESFIPVLRTEVRVSADSLQQWRKNLHNAMSLEVEKRLDDALHKQHEKNPIPLRMEDRREQVGRAAQPEIQSPEPNQQGFLSGWLRPRRLWGMLNGKERQVVAPQERIIDIFHKPEIGGRLLILGEPGAGKTTMLLELARDLLAKAQLQTSSSQQPIPVLFEMSRYPGKMTIGQWLVQDLKDRYNIPLAHTEVALQQGQLLPLIDGLDEVGLTRQKDCIDQINCFLREGILYSPQLSLVVCCRQQEYREGEAILEMLHGAIYLQALDDNQIQKYLQGLKRKDLWPQIQRDPVLLELATIPLFLHLIPVAYLQGINSRQSTDGQETEATLLEAYVQCKLMESTARARRKYSPEQTRDYLTWLAQSLKLQGQTDFYIEEMQKDLLANGREYWCFRMIASVVYGLFLWVFLCIIITPFVFLVIAEYDLEITYFSLFLAFIFSFVVCLIIGVAFGVFFGATTDLYIELVEFYDWPKNTRNIIVTVLVLGLFFGIIRGINFGIIQGLTFGIVRGLASGLFWGLSEGIFFGQRAETVISSRPNQGIRNSAKNAVILIPMIFPAMIVIFLLPDWASGASINLTNALMSGFIISVLVSLSFGGGKACIQHLSLRIMLCKKGVIPWNYSKFLTYAAELRLLNQVGGRYRFLHDKLREHFAKS
ncbi:NACHT domain-containing protein [Roseofilum casamattae]|uniref:NACHT domain-containing protein n=1 Tax=Roseofilum casamattae BLCC-M143 TaxID=3022442 RepID=A0ABT7BUB9_9CYAN|nr:NACHT domain-containing protein [Roseofilum casamattae]MDJ1182787.1 NACHT domain-containing protein [Roseofilum casamattae BLCC-M143]